MASESLQEVMRSIRDDPRVLSLLSKKRGQTGVRDLQGESLRASLNAAHGLLVRLVWGCGLLVRLVWVCGLLVRWCGVWFDSKLVWGVAC